jgi:hypothetical protein
VHSKRLLSCLGGALALLLAVAFAATALADGARETRVDPHDFRLIERESGPVNYYSVMSEREHTFVRSHYTPPLKTAVLGWKTPEQERQAASRLRWSWRAQVLPIGGDECADGKGDSAAVVYVTWKATLRYYTLKYVWSSVGTKRRVCGRKRNPLVAQDTIILESGPPLNEWRTVELDLKSEFRKHFADGDANAKVPDFVGIGIMSDGDQTQSPSSADYGDFVIDR